VLGAAEQVATWVTYVLAKRATHLSLSG